MKVAWVVVCLAVMLVGIGAGCGPEEKYCYGQHASCSQAKATAIADYQSRQNMVSDAGIGDLNVIE